MNKTTFAAIALSLAFLSFGSSANAQSCTAGANFCPSSSDTRDRPSPEVCFHTEVDFKGKAYCEIGPRTDSSVPKHWRNLVKSIKVYDNAKVRVCHDETLQGECAWVDGDLKRLPPGLFNHVYSFDIRQIH